MKAFYAGSFDPFTKGHLYVVKQACEIFAEVTIALGVNPRKQRVFPIEQMRVVIEEVMRREGLLSQVKVEIYQGLTVEAAKKARADYLIRGLRNGVDYDFEENLAAINHRLAGLETIYFRSGETSHVSSSFVLELWDNNAEIGEFVPPEVLKLCRDL